jgi:hypothetical protein
VIEKSVPNVDVAKDCTVVARPFMLVIPEPTPPAPESTKITSPCELTDKLLPLGVEVAEDEVS